MLLVNTAGVSAPAPSVDALLLACYEMGHQPLSLAWPQAVLRQAGLDTRLADLSVSPFPQETATQAALVGIAVPMHTALRLGVAAARQVRQANPQAHICFYGLYAWMNAEYLFENHLADSVLGGEYETGLAALAAALKNGQVWDEIPGLRTPTHPAAPTLERLSLPVPDRTGLPLISSYARLEQAGQMHLAGYAEASRGCLHTCRHCPVVPVYGGRFFVVPVETVLADIRQQVAAGALHITFGDPDFLNGPGHALKVARALHAEFPWLTFDFTTKVEHILEKRSLFPELRQLGALFVISAFESVSDAVLARLEKGHTTAQMDEALQILHDAGLAVQPTWVPFTPWTRLEDYQYLLAWIRSRRLLLHVPAVQLSIRLLVPPHSALLDQPGASAWLGALDAENFTYHWAHPDPRLDQLHAQVAALVEQHSEADPAWVFAQIEALAARLAGKPPLQLTEPAWLPPDRLAAPPPRLTENWFC